jgi:WD40 repeat protein
LLEIGRDKGISATCALFLKEQDNSCHVLVCCSFRSRTWAGQTELVGSRWSAKCSPDGARIVTASEDTTVRVWLVATGKELAQLIYEHGVLSAAFSADGLRRRASVAVE